MKEFIKTLIMIIIIGIILYFILGIVFKQIKKRIIKMYATNPESLMKSKKLSLIQLVAFENLDFDEIKQVNVVRLTDTYNLGTYHRFNFN